jgi:hypothetical protein
MIATNSIEERIIRIKLDIQWMRRKKIACDKHLALQMGGSVSGVVKAGR